MSGQYMLEPETTVPSKETDKMKLNRIRHTLLRSSVAKET